MSPKIFKFRLLKSEAVFPLTFTITNKNCIKNCEVHTAIVTMMIQYLEITSSFIVYYGLIYIHTEFISRV